MGVNKFGVEFEEPVQLFKIEDQIRDQQVQRLTSLKETRDNNQAASRLKIIRQKAVDGENLMPAVIEGVENNCTLGEISDVLRDVFGEYK